MTKITPNGIPLADRTDLSYDVLIFISKFTEAKGRKPTDAEVESWIDERDATTKRLIAEGRPRFERVDDA